jgi:glycerol-3-phosphate dehydrogenase subunit C
MNAEDRLRDEIVSRCGVCEACKTLLDLSCLVFPELFRLVDQYRETGEEISTDELRHLVDLCNFCAVCPCLKIRAAIINAKTEYMETYGLGFKTRVIENFEWVGKLAGAFPRISNLLLQNGISRGLIQKTLGIHRERRIPDFPKEGFRKWMRRHGTEPRARTKDKKKVAYFAGCTGRYLFPEVPKAVVAVLERNGIEVYYPEQQCCGMPSLLEGDKRLALKFARFNVPRLADAVEQGYDIVCSCPTCGYMLKSILRVGAYYSSEYLDSVVSTNGFVNVVVGYGIHVPIAQGIIKVRKELFEGILGDEVYFSAISPKKRILITENVYDLGEYLEILHQNGALDTQFGPVCLKAVYYPPCHQREQRIGRPYELLLRLIPGLSLQTISGIYCCGNGGIMGFKENFHHKSIKIASSLMARIKRLDPEIIFTDCLSCRIQFDQLTPYRQMHPIQMIKESYDNTPEPVAKKAISKHLASGLKK